MTSSWFPAKLVEANCKAGKHEHQAKSQQWGLATVMILLREKWSSDSGLCFLCGRGRGWVCAHVHLEAGADAAVLPPSCFTFVFETGSLPEAEAHWLGKSGWQVCLGDLSVPASPVLWLHVYATAWLFFMWVLVCELGTSCLHGKHSTDWAISQMPLSSCFSTYWA